MEEVVLTASGLDFMANSVKCCNEDEDEVVVVVSAGDVVVVAPEELPNNE